MHRVLLVLLLFSAIPVDAQYTWVRYLQLPPDPQIVREPFDKLLAGKRISASARAALALFNEWAKPVFEKLEAGGKLGRWGLSVQNVVQDNQWTYLVWYFMSDLSVLDEINAALDGAGMSRLGTYERRLRDMSEDDYVGQLFRVVYAAQ